MSKIREILENNVFCISEAEGDYGEVETAMKIYAEFKLEEFKNSEQYKSMVEDSEWLYYLECAGVDNWEGFSVARQLQKESENDD